MRCLHSRADARKSSPSRTYLQAGEAGGSCFGEAGAGAFGSGGAEDGGGAGGAVSPGDYRGGGLGGALGGAGAADFHALCGGAAPGDGVSPLSAAGVVAGDSGAIVLLPALVLRWKLGVALAVFLAVSPWWVFGFRSGGPTEQGKGDGITVLTYNSGQSGPVPLGVVAGGGFPDEVGADVVAMQDMYVYFRDHKLGKGYQPPELAEYPHLHRLDEFVTYSKYAYVESTPVRLRVNGRLDTVAIRHVIDVRGRLLVFFNVHLPTPRYLLKRASPTAIAFDYFGPDSTSDPVDSYQRALQDGWDAQTETALSLLALIRAETLPTIAAGDFNFPRYGYLARTFRSGLAEARPADGLGFTFPGTTRNPLSFARPWMRLDHLFSADPALLLPETAITERGRRSQHLATAATFRFR